MPGSKPKRPVRRKDSAHEQVRILQEAKNGIAPPKYIKLRRQDKPFWKAITEARATWTEPDLVTAAALARTQADLVRLMDELDKEPDVIAGVRGKITNPKHQLVETLTKRVVYLSRMLQVHTLATVGKSSDAVGKNEAKREAIAQLSQATDDDLIARPVH